ncbi:MAG: chorismate synthase [Desulfotomaculum sp.]|nr:chorismate synthase [Desulfotomaculum sp.]
MLRFLNAGESHGPALTAIIEGLPAGMKLLADDINYQLARRQSGYGRGGRMKIEKDRVEILSGVRGGYTIGSPVTLQIKNKDYENWKDTMNPEPKADLSQRVVTRPRPGHADLAGAMKYRHSDIRNVLERASARETAIRVAVGSAARCLLKELGIEIFGMVCRIGSVHIEERDYSISEIKDAISRACLLCPDVEAEKKMVEEIDKCKAAGDSIGGVFEIRAYNVMPGLGSYVHYDRKLDGRLAMALMSIQAVKGVEIGCGFKAGMLTGSQVHDEIFYDKEKGFYRKTNNAGGIEGGMSNGETIIVRAVMKPIPTLYKPLKSVDLKTKEQFEASVERSDVCAVPAATVVGESAVAWELAKAILEKFPADTMHELKESVERYREYVKQI